MEKTNNNNNMSAIAAAAITGAAGLLGSGISTIGSYYTNKQQKEMQELEFAHNKEMWKLQNEYNDPKNQMARYRDAGLNPHLMYGSISSGNATNAPQYNAPNLENPYSALGSGLADTGAAVVNSYLGAKSMDADISLRNSQAEKNLAEAEFIRGAKTRNTNTHTDLIGQQTETEKARTRQTISQAVSAEVKANVDTALESVYIAIENQKLNNLTAQEKEIYSRIAAQDFVNKLNQEKITTEKFMRSLKKEELKLQKELAKYQKYDILNRNENDNLRLSAEQYRLNLQRLALVTETKQWVEEFVLKRDYYDLDVEKHNLDVDKHNYEKSKERSEKMFRLINFLNPF